MNRPVVIRIGRSKWNFLVNTAKNNKDLPQLNKLRTLENCDATKF